MLLRGRKDKLTSNNDISVHRLRLPIIYKQVCHETIIYWLFFTCRSFPDNYWDKFVKKKVCELLEYCYCAKIMPILHLYPPPPPTSTPTDQIEAHTHLTVFQFSCQSMSNSVKGFWLAFKLKSSETYRILTLMLLSSSCLAVLVIT